MDHWIPDSDSGWNALNAGQLNAGQGEGFVSMPLRSPLESPCVAVAGDDVFLEAGTQPESAFPGFGNRSGIIQRLQCFSSIGV